MSVKDFLEAKKILIVDPSVTSRSGLYNVFQELGAKTGNIVMANTFNQGESLIVSEKPHVVVTEFDIGSRCGLELLQKQREQRPKETKESVFVIVTGNTSQTAVAQAAEEDVDGYVIKPYTNESVRSVLLDAFARKIQPSEYIVKIEEGKRLLEERRFKEAEDKFTQATQLDSSPSLAYYYLGYAKYVQEFLHEAKGKYESGLQFNKIHYKCLVGLYDLLMAEKEHDKAYEIVRRISEYFPANPKRLSEILRLAILTGKFQDIEEYYQVFTKLDERDEVLIQHVCAALIVCGKHFLSTESTQERAISLFRKVTATGRARSFFLKEIILSLLEQNLEKEAKTFLLRFLPEDQKAADFLVCQLLIGSKSGMSLSSIIDQGRTLLAKGVVSHYLYLLMIERFVESGLKDAAEDLLIIAIKNFPEEKQNYEKLLAKASSTE